MSNDEISEIANEIVDIFPNENKKDYYQPPTLKRVSKLGKSEHARGRLINKFNNKLRLFRTLSEYGGSHVGDVEVDESSFGIDQIFSTSYFNIFLYRILLLKN